jgi:hypothetical protein
MMISIRRFSIGDITNHRRRMTVSLAMNNIQNETRGLNSANPPNGTGMTDHNTQTIRTERTSIAWCVRISVMEDLR